MSVFRAASSGLRLAGMACLAALPTTGVCAPPAAASPTATLDITLGMMQATHGAGTGVTVSYTYQPAQPVTTPVTLLLDTLEPGLERSTDRIADLRVTDDRGELPVAAPVTRKDGPRTFESWTTTRPASGAVHVSYRMPVARGAVAKRGPQVDLQAAGSGVSGGYIGIFVLPDTKANFTSHVHWKLPPGDMAVTSYGVGDYSGTFSADQLTGTLFLAGPVKTYRPLGQAKDAGLEVYGLGVAESQLEAAGGWAAAAYAAELKAFKLKGRPYRFMIRSFAGGSNPSGRAAEHSFMLYVPPGANPGTNDLHYVVAHEMVHSLARYLEKEDVGGDWYTEGLANYVALTVPDAAGLYTPAEYLELVRKESAGYYTNAKRALPNSALPAVVWSGRNAWLLPYNRGTLYLADLDAKLKKHGLGVRVLDLANEMSARINAGEPSDQHTWLDMLSQRAGPWAIKDWNDMMDGKIIFPTAGAFGSCLHASKDDVRIFDLGFTSPVRLQAGATISGVAKGSAAEKAGLRDGDVLVESVDTNPAAQSLDAPIVLHVQRADKSLTVTYAPQGGSQPGLAWNSSCVR
ncbi:MAG TPA: hypothetical protein VGN46_07640 [Luteibacter sp.]|jgi:hypothetical protein|uniref:hypothetical protein n=1 Tax=Luteibacter sp. TaxID=1886636 RepID=UPI002F42EC04